MFGVGCFAAVGSASTGLAALSKKEAPGCPRASALSEQWDRMGTVKMIKTEKPAFYYRGESLILA